MSVQVDDADQEIFYDALTNVHPRQPQVFLKDIFLYPVKSCRAMRVSKNRNDCLKKISVKYD